jgi:hypothetical protein
MKPEGAALTTLFLIPARVLERAIAYRQQGIAIRIGSHRLFEEHVALSELSTVSDDEIVVTGSTRMSVRARMDAIQQAVEEGA